MSSIKIKDLPEKKDNLDDDDLMVIEDKEDTKRIPLIKLRSAFSMDGILTSMKNMLLEKINTFAETHSSKYKELLEKNNDLEVICHNLQNDHDHDAQRIFELENELIKQEGIVKTLQDEKSKLLKDITQLSLDKDTLSEQITLLNKEVTVNNEKIVILRSQVKDLQLKAKELKSINDGLQNIIDSLEKESTEKIDDNYKDINSKFDKTIGDIMDYIRYYHPDVDDINI